MNKVELVAFIGANMIKHEFDIGHGYSHGEYEFENPDAPVTQLEWKMYQMAYNASLADLFVELGLIDES